MVNRIFFRLKDLSITVSALGVILLFKSLIYGAFLITGGVVSFFLFAWLYKKTIHQIKYNADENGNAKPNFR